MWQCDMSLHLNTSLSETEVKE